MDAYLLIFGVIIVCCGYFIIFIDYVTFRGHTEMSGFDMAKDITSNYQDINIVLASNLWISKYYLKRKVIRLSKKDYSSSDFFSLFVVSYLSCISLVENKYMSLLSKIFPSIDYINKSSIILMVLSCFLYTKSDARIGIVLGIIILIYQYFYLQIVNDVLFIAKDRIVYEKEKMLQKLQHLYVMNQLLFISSLIFLLRFIVIIII